MKMKHLHAGDTAPAISAVDVEGRPLDVLGRDTGFTLLVFLRYAGCPFCNLSLHRLTLEYPILKRHNCEVIAFIQSDGPTIREHIYGRHKPRPPYAIVADPKRKIYDRYGIGNSLPAAIKSIKHIPFWLESVYGKGFRQQDINGDHFLVPASFLINQRDGRIAHASYGSSFYDNRTFTAILEPLIFDGV